MYSMQRKFGVIVGTFTLGFAGVLGAGLPAAAETADMSMQSGIFYVYEHDDFEGGWAWFTDTDNDLTDNTWDGEGGRFLNDNISSMMNGTDRNVLLYENAGCSGLPYSAKRHSTDKDLTRSDNNPSFDNMASCVEFQ